MIKPTLVLAQLPSFKGLIVESTDTHIVRVSVETVSIAHYSADHNKLPNDTAYVIMY